MKQEEYIEQLIIDQLTGNISDADNALLERIKQEDSTVNDLYLEYQKVFRGGKAASFLNRIDQHAAWNKFEQQMRRDVLQPVAPKIVQLRRWLIAASVILPLLIASFFLFKGKIFESNRLAERNTKQIKLVLASGEEVTLNDKGNTQSVNTKEAVLFNENGALKYQVKDPKKALDYNTLLIPRKEDYKIQLSDGTEVWLNSESELKFPMEFDAQKRVVYLKGEAYFKVAKNPEKPFIVKVNEVDVKVLGTSFNVNSYQNNTTRIALVEGSVKLSTSGAEMKLTPGNMATYETEKGFSQSKFDQQSVLSWMKGIYFFSNTRVGDIAETIHRWYDVELSFEDENLRNVRISGAIEKNKSLTLFLQNLSKSSQLTYTIKKDKVIISK